MQLSAALLGLLCVTAAGQCTLDAGCACGLSTEDVSRIETKISTGGAYMYAIPNMRCSITGRAKFRQCGISLKEDTFRPSDIASSWNNFDATTDPTWKYMQCKYPVSAGG